MHRMPKAIAGFAAWRILAAWAILPLASVLAADTARTKPAETPSTGELVLRGKHIQSLVLVGKHGERRVVGSPNRVSLPAGQYGVQEIQLKGGYCSYGDSDLPTDGPPSHLLTIAAGKSCRPKFGAPLNPSVKVKREGRLLTIDYVLLDGDGRKYRHPDYDRSPPTFTVYHGDRSVGSGKFEYG
jgi:hypothetical protein